MFQFLIFELLLNRISFRLNIQLWVILFDTMQSWLFANRSRKNLDSQSTKKRHNPHALSISAENKNSNKRRHQKIKDWKLVWNRATVFIKNLCHGAKGPWQAPTNRTDLHLNLPRSSINKALDKRLSHSDQEVLKEVAKVENVSSSQRNYTFSHQPNMKMTFRYHSK